MAFPGGAVVKNLPANAGDAGDMGSIPGSGRFQGEGNGNPLEYSHWENPWTEEPGRLQFRGGLKESDTTELACIQASGSTCPFTIYPGDWWGHSLLTRLKLKQ